MDYLRGIVGLAFIVGVAYLLSINRKKIDWRLVAIGLFIQIVIGLLIAKVGFVRGGFEFVSEKFVIFLESGFHFCISGIAYSYLFLSCHGRALLPGRTSKNCLRFCVDHV
jgi:CNT family concentrative nucleoside transporter